MNRSKLVPMAVVLVLAVLLGILLYGTKKHQPKPLFYSGVVESTEHDLAFEIPGTLAEFLVSEGDAVESGFVLARLDQRELESQLEGARARLGQAKAHLQELENGTRVEDIEIAEARVEQLEAELAKLRNGPTRPELEAARHQAESAGQFASMRQRGNRPQEIQQAQARLEQTEAQLSNARRDKERFQILFEQGAAPAAELETKVERYRVAQAAVQERREALDQLRVGFRPEEKAMAVEESLAAQARYQNLAQGTRPELIASAEAQLRSSRAHLQQLVRGPRAEQIEAAVEAVKAGEAEVQTSLVRLSKTELKSPLSGVVTRRAFDQGETVGAGVGVVQLTVPQETWVDIFIPETDVAKLKLDDPCQVFVDSYPEKSFTGRLSYISQTAEFTPRFVQTQTERVLLVYRAKVAVDDPEHLLKPGLPADVQVKP
jgi:membrane fusion protein YbhG